MWIAPFLDQMAAILCKLSMLADTQEPIPKSEEKKKQESGEESDDLDKDNENKHIEVAQQEMNKLNQ